MARPKCNEYMQLCSIIRTRRCIGDQLMLRALAHHLLPAHCVVCQIGLGRPAAAVCAPCEADFFPVLSRCPRCAISLSGAAQSAVGLCGRCLAQLPHFDATSTLADYVSPVDGMVIAMKFTARLDLAHFFGRLLAERAGPEIKVPNQIIAVPLAFERVRERGFNQSHHIAKALAAASGGHLANDRLLRVRNTPPQQSLSINERRRNVRGAFAVQGTLEHQSVFVVDDVMTTGSTLNEIARVLKQAGAARVHNLIVARTPE